MLLNKFNVLDKGFVALLEVCGNGKTLQDLQDTYFRTKINAKLLEVSKATFVIKAPLFIQLNLSQYGFSIISTPSDDIEAYIPDISQINGNSLGDRQRISEYISSTTEALLLNSKGMPMDGADELTTQLLTPISVYNEIVVSGNIRQWLKYVSQKDLPKPAEAYREVIEKLLESEWKNLQKLKALK